MRLVSVRWISLLLLIVGLATVAQAAAGAAGRWKLGDDGSCYLDENDAGPDQCSPQAGRWKLGGDGSCYFDAQDSGPNQCLPLPTEPGPALEQSATSGTEDRAPIVSGDPPARSAAR